VPLIRFYEHFDLFLSKNLRNRIDSFFATTGKNDILLHSMVVTQIAGIKGPDCSGPLFGENSAIRNGVEQ
jgi:hypothetical protein